MFTPDSLPLHIAQFALERSDFDAVPPEVIAVSKEMMVNAAAVGLAGAAQPESCAITRLVQEMGGNGKCTIIGKGLRTSPVYAALANGAMIHLLDFDDEIIPSRSHPSSVIFPVTMALGEMKGSSGAEVLAAFVLGCELAAKLDEACGVNAFPDCLSTGYAAGAIAAAAAAGRLLGLNLEQLVQALVLAGDTVWGRQSAGEPTDKFAAETLTSIGSNAGSVAERGNDLVGSDPRQLGRLSEELAGPARAWRQGRAAMNGLMAALLAQQGLNWPALLPPLSPYGNDFDRDGAEFFTGLGNPYRVVNPGVALKLYPCATPAHTAIDVALQLSQQYRLDPDQIAVVQLAATPTVLDAMPFAVPGSGWEARFSLSYIVATTLVYGHPLIDNFTDVALEDRRLKDLMGRVTIAAGEKQSPSIPYPCSLDITLKDGRQLRHRVEFARGQPELSLTSEELTAKFLYCSRYILPPDHIEEAVTRLRNLENIENTTGLFSVLGG